MSELDKRNTHNLETAKDSDEINQPQIGNKESSYSVLSKPLEKEINGPKGLEPTRYGDWESKGRCYDF